MSRLLIRTLSLLCLFNTPSNAIDVRAEMKRAESFANTAPSLIVGNDVQTYWSTDDSHLCYRVNSALGKTEYFEVDLDSGKKSPAFDQNAFAASLASAANQKVDPNNLPIDDLEFSLDAHTLYFQAFGKSWVFSKSDSSVSPNDQPPKEIKLISPEEAMRGSRKTGKSVILTIENATPGDLEVIWINDVGERKSYGKLETGQSTIQQTYAGHVWLMTDSNGTPLAGIETPSTQALARIKERIPPPPRSKANLSPDGSWRAIILNHNVAIEPIGSGSTVVLSTDGTPEDHYAGPFHWSPDSKKLIAYRAKSIGQRQISIIHSSPPDQVQPKVNTLNYAKPGDAIAQPTPCLFDLNDRRQIPLDNKLFSNPWEISEGAWNSESTEYSFVYNQRGHQVMRIVGILGDSGSARTISEDTSETFIDYSQKFFFRRLPATREILWASERDGFNHLYRIDELSGDIKNPITKGRWNVREVLEIDEVKQQILLKIVGFKGQDPYHEHFVRVNFDGTESTKLTTSDGNHQIEFSPCKKFIIDRWSRVDHPQVIELRRAEDGKLISELEQADDRELIKTGWSRPERFTAKARDGKTDIHGIIIRPTRFDPSKKYPIVEDIYAGPHDHFVPKSYFTWSRKNTMAELGFIVVSIDGMGTNWRSKAFHDVCWKNLADSGFPDRIPWIKAAAESRPWMNLSRVGIYGGSAGGQSALAGLLHHGNFYKVGVADCGCHDNRMDKIWWNEAWMGWPVDESYERNSNVTHAAKLTGKLLLIVGELDTNVDPASSAQVVHALQKADKDFEFLPIMNTGHGAAETPYGNRRRADFLVQNLGAN